MIIRETIKTQEVKEIKYIAEDGVEFSDRISCQKYEVKKE